MSSSTSAAPRSRPSGTFEAKASLERPGRRCGDPGGQDQSNCTPRLMSELPGPGGFLSPSRRRRFPGGHPKAASCRARRPKLPLHEAAAVGHFNIRMVLARSWCQTSDPAAASDSMHAAFLTTTIPNSGCMASEGARWKARIISESTPGV